MNMFRANKDLNTDKSDMLPVMAKVALIACALVHFSLLISFFVLGIYIMAIINCFSVSIYIILAFIIGQDNLRTCMLVAYYEILCHAVLALLLLGWESGFGLYIFALIPMAFYVLYMTTEAGKKRNVQAYALCIFAMLILLLARIYHVVRDDTYYNLSTVINNIFYLYNAFICLAMLLLSSLIFSRKAKENQDELAQKSAELLKQSVTDRLSGLMNRNSMMDYIVSTHRVNTYDNRCYHIAIGDIDDFKSINESHGYDCGDMLLQMVSKIIKEHISEPNLCARWNGEEFLLLIMSMEKEGAQALLEGIRTKIAAATLSHKGQDLSVSITFGMATAIQGDAAQKAISVAEANMRLGKESGKNTVKVS